MNIQQKCYFADFSKLHCVIRTWNLITTLKLRFCCLFKVGTWDFVGCSDDSRVSLASHIADFYAAFVVHLSSCGFRRTDVAVVIFNVNFLYIDSTATAAL